MQRRTGLSRAIVPIGVLLGAVIALTGPVSAQVGNLEPASPAGPSTELGPEPISEITGAATGEKIIDPGRLTYKGSLRKVRGMLTEISMDWSVPGFPDTVQSLWNSDEYEVPGGMGRAKIHAGTFLLRDSNGAWAGPFGGVQYLDGSTDLQATLMGSAGYDGQCAILNVLWTRQLGWEMDGLMFDCQSLDTMTAPSGPLGS